jgi:hypothetical protein
MKKTAIVILVVAAVAARAQDGAKVKYPQGYREWGQ